MERTKESLKFFVEAILCILRSFGLTVGVGKGGLEIVDAGVVGKGVGDGVE